MSIDEPEIAESIDDLKTSVRDEFCALRQLAENGNKKIYLVIKELERALDERVDSIDEKIEKSMTSLCEIIDLFQKLIIFGWGFIIIVGAYQLIRWLFT